MAPGEEGGGRAYFRFIKKPFTLINQTNSEYSDGYREKERGKKVIKDVSCQKHRGPIYSETC